MRDNAADEIQRRAVEWHIRLRDGDDDLWDSFSLWLTEDVRHVEAYETVERLDNALEPFLPDLVFRSEEQTTELQSLMRSSYAVFCLKKKNQTTTRSTQI